MTMAEGTPSLPPASAGNPGAACASRPRRYRRLFLILGALLVFVLGFVLLKDSVLGALAQKRLRQETGLSIQWDRFQTALGSGAISIQNLRLQNPPGFGDSPLLDLPELYLEVHPASFTAGHLRLRTVRIQVREIHLVRDSQGRLNLEWLRETHARQPRDPGSSGVTNAAPARVGFGGIDELHLTLHRLVYTDLRRGGERQEIPLNIQGQVLNNLRSTEELEAGLQAVLVRALIQEYWRNPQGLGSLLRDLRGR